MENIAQYIDVLVQAPIAVILIVYIYLNNKSNNSFNASIIEQQNKIIQQQGELLSESLKIIKQQERNG